VGAMSKPGLRVRRGGVALPPHPSKETSMAQALDPCMSFSGNTLEASVFHRGVFGDEFAQPLRFGA